MKKSLILLSILTIVMFSLTELQAKIIASRVKGSVAYKSGKNWQPLKSGMTLSQGTKISTGVNSTAVIKMDSHTVTIKPLTMIKIYENSLRKGRSENRIGLRRGTIRAKVSRSKRIKTVFKVSTPVATSSVRGTDEIISYGPLRGMRIKMIKGIAVGTNKNGNSKILKGGLEFHQRHESNLPDDPLKRIRGKGLVQLYSDYLSRDEKAGFIFAGSDFLSSPRGLLSTLSSLQNSALVNIAIIWP